MTMDAENQPDDGGLGQLVLDVLSKFNYPSYTDLDNRLSNSTKVASVKMNNLGTTLGKLAEEKNANVIRCQFATNKRENRLNTYVRMAVFLGDLKHCGPSTNFLRGCNTVMHKFQHTTAVDTGTHNHLFHNPTLKERRKWMRPRNSQTSCCLWGVGHWIGIEDELHSFEEKFLKPCESDWEQMLMKFPLILEFAWQSGEGDTWYTTMAVHHQPRGLLVRIGEVRGAEDGKVNIKCWSIPKGLSNQLALLNCDELKVAIGKILTGKLFPSQNSATGGGTINKCQTNLRIGLKVIDACCLLIDRRSKDSGNSDSSNENKKRKSSSTAGEAGPSALENICDGDSSSDYKEEH